MASDLLVFLGAGALAAAALSGWPLPVAGGLALLVACLCVIAARRFRVGAALFARIPRAALLAMSRTPAHWRGALGVLGAALDLRPGTPAFVRLRLRPSGPEGLRSVTETFSATPGMIAVDAEPQGLLAHVMDEATVEVAPLQRLEATALAAAGERP